MYQFKRLFVSFLCISCAVDLESKRPILIPAATHFGGVQIGIQEPRAEDLFFQDPPSPDYVPGPEEPEQAPPSPIYVPFVPEPVYPEFLPEDDVLPAEEQPFPVAASPTTESPGYISESDPEEDPEGDDDDDDAVEEHLAPADPAAVAYLADQDPYLAYRVTARMSIRPPGAGTFSSSRKMPKRLLALTYSTTPSFSILITTSTDTLSTIYLYITTTQIALQCFEDRGSRARELDKRALPSPIHETELP
ncbi:hypothetical protein Tco_0292032 [Tanacetum coccineum]